MLKKIPRLENYQSFVGTKRVTTKSGCVFYSRNGIKYKQRKDLDISCYDDNNEFKVVGFKLSKNMNKYCTRGFYRHPEKTLDNIPHDKFDQILKRISK